MTDSGNRQPSIREVEYHPRTQELIDLVRENPELSLRCFHGDDQPAIGIYEVPGGCVAHPGLETQALCPQHIISDGSFGGMRLVVDLSVNAAWSKNRGEEPDYCMILDQESGRLKLAESHKEF